jgi:hypothetical protein
MSRVVLTASHILPSRQATSIIGTLSTGGITTNSITVNGDLNMSAGKVVNVGTPVASTDATTMSYADLTAGSSTWSGPITVGGAVTPTAATVTLNRVGHLVQMFIQVNPTVVTDGIVTSLAPIPLEYRPVRTIKFPVSNDIGAGVLRGYIELFPTGLFNLNKTYTDPIYHPAPPAVILIALYRQTMVYSLL